LQVLDSLEDDADFWAHFGGRPKAVAAATPDKDVSVMAVGAASLLTMTALDFPTTEEAVPTD
jgi:hypothetical protein